MKYIVYTKTKVAVVTKATVWLTRMVTFEVEVAEVRLIWVGQTHSCRTPPLPVQCHDVGQLEGEGPAERHDCERHKRSFIAGLQTHSPGK